MIKIVAILILLAAAAYLLYTPDIADSVLLEKYAKAPSKFITLPSGATVHYRDQGKPDGKPIVLLHGTLGSLHGWEGWVNTLRNQFRLISLDLPAHGLTSTDLHFDYSEQGMISFIDEFTTALKLDSFALAGHSSGGTTAAGFTLAYPERVTKLILIDASVLPPKEQSASPRVTKLTLVDGHSASINKTSNMPIIMHFLYRPILRKSWLYFLPRYYIEDVVNKVLVNKENVTQNDIDAI